MIDKKDKTKEVTISKQDITNGKELPGAVLIIKDKDGKEIEKWTSTNEVHKVKLPYGEYTLTEISAPSGYVKAETISFKISEENKEAKIVMKDDVTKVEISKFDKETNKMLSGASLELYNEKGKKIDAWTTDGKVKTFTNLAHGKYTLKEIKAPTGYELAKDIVFEVTDENKTVEVKMYDEKTVVNVKEEKDDIKPVKEEVKVAKEAPANTVTRVQTGDSNNAVLYIILIIALVLVSVKAYKIYNKKD